MGRMVIAPFVDLAVTSDATQDIWQITAGATNPIIIHGFELSSAKIAAELVSLQLVRYATTGSVGAAVTEVLVGDDTGTITAAVLQLNTTPGGTPTPLMGWQWEQLGPLVYLPTPETRIVVGATDILALNTLSAPAATTNWSGHLIWEEI